MTSTLDKLLSRFCCASAEACIRSGEDDRFIFLRFYASDFEKEAFISADFPPSCLTLRSHCLMPTRRHGFRAVEEDGVEDCQAWRGVGGEYNQAWAASHALAALGRSAVMHGRRAHHGHHRADERADNVARASPDKHR